MFALKDAIIAGDIHKVRTILSNKNINVKNVNIRDADTPRMIRTFAEAGVPVDSADAYGFTFLMTAAGYNDPDIVKTLIAVGANLNSRDDEMRQTPLLTAIEKSRLRNTMLLIKAGADVNARDENDRTPLMYAVEKRHGRWRPVVKLLLAYGAKLDTKDVDGDTALLNAWSRHNTWAFGTLLDAGADPNEFYMYVQNHPMFPTRRMTMLYKIFPHEIIENYERAIKETLNDLITNG
jgi:ankyrin repeat protein